MSKKSKINPIEKVKTVEQYLNGEIGIFQAGKELGVSYQSIQKWVSYQMTILAEKDLSIPSA